MLTLAICLASVSGFAAHLPSLPNSFDTPQYLSTSGHVHFGDFFAVSRQATAHTISFTLNAPSLVRIESRAEEQTSVMLYDKNLSAFQMCQPGLFCVLRASLQPGHYETVIGFTGVSEIYLEAAISTISTAQLAVERSCQDPLVAKKQSRVPVLPSMRLSAPQASTVHFASHWDEGYVVNLVKKHDILIGSWPIELRKASSGLTGFWFLDFRLDYNFLIGGTFQLILVQEGVVGWSCQSINTSHACLMGVHAKNQVSMQAHLSPGRYTLGLLHKSDVLGSEDKVVASCARFAVNMHLQYHPPVVSSFASAAARYHPSGCDGDHLPASLNAGGLLSAMKGQFFDKRVRFNAESLSQTSTLTVEEPSLFRIVVSHAAVQFDIDLYGPINASFAVKPNQERVEDSGLFVKLPAGNYTLVVGLADHFILDGFCDLVTIGMALSDGEGSDTCTREMLPDASLFAQRAPSKKPQKSHVELDDMLESSSFLSSSKRHLLASSSSSSLCCEFQKGIQYESSAGDPKKFTAETYEECCQAILRKDLSAKAFTFSEGSCAPKTSSQHMFQSGKTGVVSGVIKACGPEAAKTPTAARSPKKTVQKSSETTQSISFSSPLSSPTRSSSSASASASSASASASSSTTSATTPDSKLFCAANDIKKTYSLLLVESSEISVTVMLQFLWADFQLQLLTSGGQVVASSRLYQQTSLAQRHLNAKVEPGLYTLALESVAHSQVVSFGAFKLLEVSIKPQSPSSSHPSSSTATPSSCPYRPPLPSALSDIDTHDSAAHGLKHSDEVTQIMGRYQIPDLTSIAGAHQGIHRMKIVVSEHMLLSVETFHPEVSDSVHLLLFNTSETDFEEFLDVTNKQYLSAVLSPDKEYWVHVIYRVDNSEFQIRSTACLYIDLQLALTPISSKLLVSSKPKETGNNSKISSSPLCVTADPLIFPMPAYYSLEQNYIYHTNSSASCDIIRSFSFYIFDPLTEFRALLRYDFALLGLTLRLVRMGREFVQQSTKEAPYAVASMGLNSKEVQSVLLPTGQYRLDILDLTGGTLAQARQKQAYSLVMNWYERSMEGYSSPHCVPSHPELLDNSSVVESLATLGSDSVHVLRAFRGPQLWGGVSYQIEVKVDEAAYFRLMLSQKHLAIGTRIHIKKAASQLPLYESASNEMAFMGRVRSPLGMFLRNFLESRMKKQNIPDFTGLAGKFPKAGTYTIQIFLEKFRAPNSVLPHHDCNNLVDLQLAVKEIPAHDQASCPLPQKEKVSSSNGRLEATVHHCNRAGRFVRDFIVNVTDYEALFSLDVGFDFLQIGLKASLHALGTPPRFASQHQNQLVFSNEPLRRGVYTLSILDPFGTRHSAGPSSDYASMDASRPFMQCDCTIITINYLLLSHRDDPSIDAISPLSTTSPNCLHEILPSKLDLQAAVSAKLGGKTQDDLTGAIEIFSNQIALRSQTVEIAFTAPSESVLRLYMQTDEEETEFSFLLFANSKKNQVLHSGSQRGVLESLHVIPRSHTYTLTLTVTVSEEDLPLCPSFTLLLLLHPASNLTQTLTCDKKATLPSLASKPLTATSVSNSFGSYNFAVPSLTRPPTPVQSNRRDSLLARAFTSLRDSHPEDTVQIARIPLTVSGNDKHEFTAISVVVGYGKLVPSIQVFVRNELNVTIAAGIRTLSEGESANAMSFGTVLEATLLPEEYFLDVELNRLEEWNVGVHEWCVPFIFNIEFALIRPDSAQGVAKIINVLPSHGEHLDPFQDFKITLQFSEPATPTSSSVNSTSAVLRHNSVLKREHALIWLTETLSSSVALSPLPIYGSIIFSRDLLKCTAIFDSTQLKPDTTYQLHIASERFHTPDHRGFQLALPSATDFIYHFTTRSLAPPVLGLGLELSSSIYNCQFQPGSHLAGNKCVSDLKCQPDTCHGHGTCIEVSGTIRCICDMGFVSKGDSFCSTCDPLSGSPYPNCSFRAQFGQEYYRSSACGANLLPVTLDLPGTLPPMHLFDRFYIPTNTQLHVIHLTLQARSILRLYVSAQMVNWSPIDILTVDRSPSRFRSVRLLLNDKEVVKARKLFGEREFVIFTKLEPGKYAIVLEFNNDVDRNQDICPQFTMELAIDDFVSREKGRQSKAVVPNIPLLASGKSNKKSDVKQEKTDDGPEMLDIPLDGFAYTSPTNTLVHLNASRVVYRLPFRVPHKVQHQAYIIAVLDFEFLVGQLRLVLFDNNIVDSFNHGWFSELSQNRNSLRLPLLPGQYEITVFTPLELDPALAPKVHYDFSFQINFTSLPSNVHEFVQSAALREECDIQRLPTTLNSPEYLGTGGSVHIYGKFRLDHNHALHNTSFTVPKSADKVYSLRLFLPLEQDGLGVIKVSLLHSEGNTIESMNTSSEDCLTSVISAGSYFLQFELPQNLVSELLLIEEACHSLVLELSIAPVARLKQVCNVSEINVPKLPTRLQAPYDSLDTKLRSFMASVSKKDWQKGTILTLPLELRETTWVEITVESDFTSTPLQVLLQGSERALRAQQHRSNVQVLDAELESGSYTIYLNLLAPLDFGWYAQDPAPACVAYYFRLQLLPLNAQTSGLRKCQQAGVEVLPSYFNPVDQANSDDSGHLLGRFLLPSALNKIGNSLRFSLRSVALVRIEFEVADVIPTRVRLLQYSCASSTNCRPLVVSESLENHFTIIKFLQSAIYVVSIEDLRQDKKNSTLQKCESYQMELAIKPVAQLSMSSSAMAQCEHEARGVGGDHWPPVPPLAIDGKYHYDSTEIGETLYYQQRAGEPRREDMVFHAASPFRLFAEVAFDFLVADLALSFGRLSQPRNQTQPDWDGHFALSEKDKRTFTNVIYEDELNASHSSSSAKSAPRSPIEIISYGTSHLNRHVISFVYVPAGDYILSIYEPAASLEERASLASSHLGWFCPKITFRLDIELIRMDALSVADGYSALHDRGSSVLVPSRHVLDALPQYHPLPTSLDTHAFLTPAQNVHFFGLFSLYPSGSNTTQGRNRMQFTLTSTSLFRIYVNPHQTSQSSTPLDLQVVVRHNQKVVLTLALKKSLHPGVGAVVVLLAGEYTLTIAPSYPASSLAWVAMQLQEVELELAVKPLADWRLITPKTCFQNITCDIPDISFTQTSLVPAFTAHYATLRFCNNANDKTPKRIIPLKLAAKSGVLLQMGYEFIDNHLLTYIVNTATKQKWLSAGMKNRVELYAVLLPGHYEVIIHSVGALPSELNDKCIDDRYFFSLHVNNLTEVKNVKAIENPITAHSKTSITPEAKELDNDNDDDDNEAEKEMGGCQQAILPNCLFCTREESDSRVILSANSHTARLHSNTFGFGKPLEDKTSLMVINVTQKSYFKVDVDILSSQFEVVVGVLLPSNKLLKPLLLSPSLHRNLAVWLLDAHTQYIFATIATRMDGEKIQCPSYSLDLVVAPAKSLSAYTKDGCGGSALPQGPTGPKSVKAKWDGHNKLPLLVNLKLHQDSEVFAKLLHPMINSFFMVSVIDANENVMLRARHRTLTTAPSLDSEVVVKGMLQKGSYVVVIEELFGTVFAELGESSNLCVEYSWMLTTLTLGKSEVEDYLPDTSPSLSSLKHSLTVPNSNKISNPAQDTPRFATSCSKCHNGGACNPLDGKCMCLPGFSGSSCQERLGLDRLDRIVEQREMTLRPFVAYWSLQTALTQLMLGFVCFLILLSILMHIKKRQRPRVRYDSL